MKTLLTSLILITTLFSSAFALDTGDYKLTMKRGGGEDVREFHLKIGDSNVLATTVDSTGKAIVLHGKITDNQLILWAPNEYNTSKGHIQTYHLLGTIRGNSATGKGSLLRGLDLHTFEWDLSADR